MCGRCLREGDTEESWMKVVECAPVKKKRKPKVLTAIDPVLSGTLVVKLAPKQQWIMKNLFILKLSGSVSYLELMRCESPRLHFRSCDTLEDYSSEVKAFLYSHCIFSSKDLNAPTNEDCQEVLSLHLLTDQQSQIDELCNVMQSIEQSLESHLRLSFGTAFILRDEEVRQQYGSFFSIVSDVWNHLSSSWFSSSSKSETYLGQEFIDTGRLLVEEELAACNAQLLILRPTNISSDHGGNSYYERRQKLSATEFMMLIKHIFHIQ